MQIYVFRCVGNGIHQPLRQHPHSYMHGPLVIRKQLYQRNPNQKLGDFLDCSYIFNVFNGIFGFYIIPKWLKKVPGHIPILFR